MRRFLALVLIAVMGLMPMSGIAALALDSGEVQDMPCHSHAAAQPDQDAAGHCAGMKGCCAVFLAPVAVPSLPAPGAQRVTVVPRGGSGFTPDHTDPPPVVS